MPSNYPILYNQTRNTIICRQVVIADTFLARLRGLMFRTSLPPEEALWLRPCNSVHMFFMQFPLDIIFIDKNLVAVHIIEKLPPWRISPLIRQAVSVIELPAGKTAGKVTVGDQLYIGTSPHTIETTSPNEGEKH